MRPVRQQRRARCGTGDFACVPPSARDVRIRFEDWLAVRVGDGAGYTHPLALSRQVAADRDLIADLDRVLLPAVADQNIWTRHLEVPVRSLPLVVADVDVE